MAAAGMIPVDDGLVVFVGLTGGDILVDGGIGHAHVFFGGLTKAGHYIMDPIKRAYDENVLSNYKGKAQIVVSALKGSEAAVLGASALGWE